MSLITQFSAQIQSLPTALTEATLAALTRLNEHLLQDTPIFIDHPDIASRFTRVLACSQFIADSLSKTPKLLIDKGYLDSLLSPTHRETYASYLAQLDIPDEATLMQQLRLFRRREMVRIAWRDLADWADLDETLQDLTLLAEACIQFALDFVYQQQCNSKGTPQLQDGTPLNLVVLGMGKLGAYELNYSSDIDLIFAFAEHGELKDRQETSYSEFFTRIVRSVVKVLDAITEDGFVFRTDIRLRPFGDSGPMIMTFEGMELYYQTQAREWERYAMVKVRQVAGDFNTGKHLMAMFKPFVYRRYLDYGAIEELRNLKIKITQELQRKDRMDNVKLGPGGIREIEFIGQAFQLIRGGKEQDLQQRGILSVLQTLEELKLLTPQDSQQLQSSYRFLRKVENHIQQYQDKQTHDLPKEPLAQEILAYSMDYESWPAFKAALDSIRQQVHAVFDQVFAVSKQEVIASKSVALWSGHTDEDHLSKQLQNLGFKDVTTILNLLQHFKKSPAIKRLTAKGAGVLDRLMPQLLTAMQEVDNADVTLKRLLKLLEEVAGRNVYLSLLEENPDALTQIIKLSAASPWICEYLAQYPALFDELLDTRSLYEPLKKQDLEQRLQLQLQGCDLADVEQYMIVLRKFKQINVLKVAAADIMGVIPIMVVSDYLTYIAEVIVAQVVDYVWATLIQKHGRPPATAETVSNFGVIGFGKLGGLELSYSSDLDMVFIYNYPDGLAITDGAKAISCAQFYGRLGQQVRHILDTRMLSGVLYEVDLRLRPNGDSGLLVTHIGAYEQYLRNNAWTWEHQALVRARFIAGDVEIKQQFEAVRHRILSLPRETETLKTEVREMREKMRESLARKEAGKFDLKQGKGGIADIEFIVQYGILAQAAYNGTLTTYTDNVRLLEALQAHGFMPKTTTDTLKKAYCTYRDYGHKLVLQDEPAIMAEAEVTEIKTQVEEIWETIMK
ncbi:MAG: bifunctional [glutamate--ammonia ligase]-adenylyl-L-tyrosine phosphorylase/[glutamate--ammonia-ligase] adenylyltransferase [Methylococcales bacterium]